MDINDPLIGKTLHDSYLIISKLGEGAMGRVYLAENIRVRERKYAIKVLKRRTDRQPQVHESVF